MSVRVSLRGMLRLVRVDTLRRVHTVGFFARRLKCVLVTLPCPTVYEFKHNHRRTIPDHDQPEHLCNQIAFPFCLLLMYRFFVNANPLFRQNFLKVKGDGTFFKFD